jgi:tRNA dimethylallyltransferase
VPVDIRGAARARREEIGGDAFFAELAARDPETSSRLNASDTQRVLRAYEVFEATGRPLAQWQNDASAGLLAGLNLARFVLSPPRHELHRRIEMRFEAMLAEGAPDEAVRLEDIDPSLPSAKILGLRELNAVHAGTMSLAEARSAAKTGTRQYAKRQVTWFRHRMADWRWVAETELSNIISYMTKFVA